jgi:hypothetical protein
MGLANIIIEGFEHGQAHRIFPFDHGDRTGYGPGIAVPDTGNKAGHVLHVKPCA